VIGLLFHHFGKDVAGGTHLILDEIHDPKKTIPIHMAPFIFVSTLLTHLVGGSAGREGTAVQIGASLSDQLSLLFNIAPDDRKRLLMAGAGAGFGAAIGVPLAGAIFGMEVLYVGKLKVVALPECLIASFTATYTARFLGAPHTIYPHFYEQGLHLKSLLIVAVAGVLFGLAARLFIILTHGIEKNMHRFITYPPYRPFLGGLILAGAFYWEHSYRYVGLGLSVIIQAFHLPASFHDPLYKIGFTALTIGSGFKGGEFVPLIFIGTTLGSTLSIIVPGSLQLLASVGFSAVFAAASNTPLACTVMAIELFGIGVWPYALVACFVGYYVSGHTSIYKGQR
jgi:H+/Cl- antiporter ClcA